MLDYSTKAIPICAEQEIVERSAMQIHRGLSSSFLFSSSWIIPWKPLLIDSQNLSPTSLGRGHLLPVGQLPRSFTRSVDSIFCFQSYATLIARFLFHLEEQGATEEQVYLRSGLGVCTILHITQSVPCEHGILFFYWGVWRTKLLLGKMNDFSTVNHSSTTPWSQIASASHIISCSFDKVAMNHGSNDCINSIGGLIDSWWMIDSEDSQSSLLWRR